MHSAEGHLGGWLSWRTINGIFKLEHQADFSLENPKAVNYLEVPEGPLVTVDTQINDRKNEWMNE